MLSSLQHRQLPSQLCNGPSRLDHHPFCNSARFVHLPCSTPTTLSSSIQQKHPLRTAKMASTKAEVPSTTEELNLLEHYELLQSIHRIPSIDKAWLLPSRTGHSLEALVAMSEVNLVANSKRKYLSFINIPKEQEKEATCNWSAFPFELTGISLLLPSSSGQKLLVVRNSDSTPKNGANPTKLEVWNSAQLVKEIWVPASIHGSIYVDGWFEGVSWSHDESYVAYVAEEPVIGKPVFGKALVSSSTQANDNDVHSWKGQGDWQEDWGESYTGKRRPCLYVADLQNGSVQKVDGVPDDLSVGQVTWAPGDSRLLIFVGWPSTSSNFNTLRKLGIKYCYNRPCALYAVQAFQDERVSDSPSSVCKLTNSITSAFLPRFSPNGNCLMFLSAEGAVTTGVHSGTNSLHVVEWHGLETSSSNLDIREVVSVAQPAGGFPGLYCQSVIASPWLSDNQTILLSSPWYSTQVILAIDIGRGDVYRVTPENDGSSWSILSLYDDYILAARSSFGEPHSLKLGVPRSSSGAKTWEWFDLCNPYLKLSDQVESILSSVSYETMSITAPSDKGLEQHYEAIFVTASRKDSNDAPAKRPLVVVVHGGPHSLYTTSFSKAYAFLVGLGLNLLLVNYRGSLGFGEEILQSLPGKAGHQDVADVLGALDLVVGKGLADSDKVAVLGGSHGGFLSAHLIGQAPDRFVTAAIINPVCNISSMVGTTDIPDWCFVETYGKPCLDAYSDAPSPQDLEKFFLASPIAHINKVKVPSLFLLGAQDRRVPISNGFQYIHALRARGLKVKVIVFPEDAHPIDRPQSEFEVWLNIGTWLKFYLERKGEVPT
ncbi:hypothetical protein GOP47_0020540 [Adiantum capillus-veneris]|uniref:acylaminoacyl-peptidase n=1 Tax=Adiantum capillus-veneris TaxID=13818 RepID=A0A9D4U9W7_ADICA|nr:hypothetical protein GOP47_0020540 [Adiantum capillus-veneris]